SALAIALNDRISVPRPTSVRAAGDEIVRPSPETVSTVNPLVAGSNPARPTNLVRGAVGDCPHRACAASTTQVRCAPSLGSSRLRKRGADVNRLGRGALGPRPWRRQQQLGETVDCVFQRRAGMEA